MLILCFFSTELGEPSWLKFLHISSEEQSENVVVLRTEGEHHSCHAGLYVEGKEDDSVVAKTVEEILEAQY